MLNRKVKEKGFSSFERVGKKIAFCLALLFMGLPFGCGGEFYNRAAAPLSAPSKASEKSASTNPDKDDWAHSHRLGLAATEAGQHKEAVIDFEKALEIHLSQLGNEDPKLAVDYTHLARAWRKRGNSPAAIKYYQQALEIDLPPLEKIMPELQKTTITLRSPGIPWEILKRSSGITTKPSKSPASFLEKQPRKSPKAIVVSASPGARSAV